MSLDKLEPVPVPSSMLHRSFLPVVVVVVSALLLLGGESARESFRFDRAGVLSGELWRLATGHFVHLGWPHFAMNAVGLGLVWFLVADAFSAQWWLLIGAVSILTMDLGLWYCNPELLWYVGLSGLLHGILAAGLIAKLRKGSPETIVLSLLLAGKLAWEQFSGPLPGSEATAGGWVVVDAHLYGALGGAMTALLWRIRVRRAATI